MGVRYRFEEFLCFRSEGHQVVGGKGMNNKVKGQGQAASTSGRCRINVTTPGQCLLALRPRSHHAPRQQQHSGQLRRWRTLKDCRQSRYRLFDMTLLVPLDSAVQSPVRPAFVLPVSDPATFTSKVVRAIVKARRITVVCGVWCSFISSWGS